MFAFRNTSRAASAATCLLIALCLACGSDEGGAGAGGTGGVGGTTGGMGGMTGGVGGMGGTTGGAGGMTTGGMGGMTGGMGGAAGMMTGGMGGMTGGTGGAGGMTGGTGGMTGGMGGDGGMTGGMGGMSGGAFTLTSTAFTDGGMLPAGNRCLDENPLGDMPGPSPALAWTNPPAGTMSFALTMTDNSNQFAHWTIFDIPASTTMLPAAVPPGDTAAGGKQSANSFPLAGPGYFGPCGTTNNPYEFTLYAIDVAMLPDVTSASDRAEVQAAIDAHDLASVSITAMSGP